jgi:hypothetical protein
MNRFIMMCLVMAVECRGNPQREGAIDVPGATEATAEHGCLVIWACRGVVIVGIG